MRGVLPAAKTSSVRVIVSVGVLVALCFSVGDGLRLLPLPYATPPTIEGAGSRPVASSPGPRRQCQFKPGSLGLPPLAQKNLQYKKAHCAPPSACAIPPPPQVPSRHGAQWRTWRDLAASVCGPAGRGPPPAA
jgi:hypothetical protein